MQRYLQPLWQQDAQFICRIYYIVKYLDIFPLLRANQSLTEDLILDIVEFLLPQEQQNELLIKGFDSATQGFTEIVEFCEFFETSEEIFQT